MPAHDHVGHFNRLALAFLFSAKGLHFHFAAQVLKMFLEDLLLLLHASRAADPRPDFANVLEVTHGSSAVENDIIPIRGKLIAFFLPLLILFGSTLILLLSRLINRARPLTPVRKDQPANGDS